MGGTRPDRNPDLIIGAFRSGGRPLKRLTQGGLGGRPLNWRVGL